MADMPRTTNPDGAATLKSLLRGLLAAMDSQNAGLASVGTKLDAVATAEAALATQMAALATKMDQMLALQVNADPKGVQWNYSSAAGGLLTTNATPIKAAVADKRHFITGLQIGVAGLTAVAVEVRDGSTVIWRGSIAPGQTIAATFPTPLRGSINSALNVVLSTAASATYVNAQGFTA